VEGKKTPEGVKEEEEEKKRTRERKAQKGGRDMHGTLSRTRLTSCAPKPAIRFLGESGLELSIKWMVQAKTESINSLMVDILKVKSYFCLLL